MSGLSLPSCAVARRLKAEQDRCDREREAIERREREIREAKAKAIQDEKDAIAKAEADRLTTMAPEHIELAKLMQICQKPSKKAPPQPRIDAITKFATYINKDNWRQFEPFAVVETLPVLLKRFDDKPKVKDVVLKTGLALVNKLSVQAFPFTLPMFFAELTEDAKWQPKLGACQLLHAYIERVANEDRDLLSACLPELVPVLSQLLHDTKQEIVEEGDATLQAAMKGITNRDLEPFTADLIKASRWLAFSRRHYSACLLFVLHPALPGLQTQCGVNSFILDSRRVLAPAPKVLGPKHISNPDFAPF